MQGCHRSEDTKTSAYSPLGIILMGLGIAEIDQESISQELGDVPIVVSNHLRTGGVIRPHHVPVLFGIKLTGELRRIYKIAEQHGELPAFGFGPVRGDW
jgi:hypothetical protein